jgi:hypothetical protein
MEPGDREDRRCLMKRSLLVLLGLLTAAILLTVPGSVAAPTVVADSPALHQEGGAAGDAHDWLAPDPYLGASEFEAVQSGTCNRCRAHPVCGSAGQKCGKEVGGPCYCRTCNGLFDCWQGRG